MKTTLSKEVVLATLTDSNKSKITDLNKQWQKEKKDLSAYKIITICTELILGAIMACYLYIGISSPCPSWGGTFLIVMGSLLACGLIHTLAKHLCQKKQEKSNKESQLSKKNLSQSICFLVNRLIDISSIVLFFYLGSLGAPLPEWGNVFLISYASLGIIAMIVLGALYFIVNNRIKIYYKNEAKKNNIPPHLTHLIFA